MSVRLVDLGGAGDAPLLLLGPSLGTSVATLWGPCAQRLTDAFHVVGFDLPGHGTNRDVATPDLTVAQLADALLDAVPASSFTYAGDSVGGAIGLQLALVAPERLDAAVLCCTGARIGSEQTWAERIDAVARGGTASLLGATPGRWFGPGFVAREPERASALLHALRDCDDDGYAAVCGALARFDVRDRLGEISLPVLAVAGSDDAVTPTAGLAEVADGVLDGRLVELGGVAHLAPIEAPAEVAHLIHGLVSEERR